MAGDWAAMQQDLITQVRTGDGSIARGPFAGRPVLLLTTTGARSAVAHTTPLCYSLEDGKVVIIASNGGGPKHPAWYHNIAKDPIVTVEAAGETYRARVVEVSDKAARRRIYDQHAAIHASFKEYEARAGERAIPVLLLERLPEASPLTTN